MVAVLHADAAHTIPCGLIHGKLHCICTADLAKGIVPVNHGDRTVILHHLKLPVRKNDLVLKARNINGDTNRTMAAHAAQISFKKAVCHNSGMFMGEALLFKDLRFHLAKIIRRYRFHLGGFFIRHVRNPLLSVDSS